MLSVVQSRAIQWERDVSELHDTEMITIANAMLNSPSFWTDLRDGEMRSDIVVIEERSVLVMCFCLNAEDDLLLQLVNVQ